jgi:hypothetical protein
MKRVVLLLSILILAGAAIISGFYLIRTSSDQNKDEKEEQFELNKALDTKVEIYLVASEENPKSKTVKVPWKNEVVSLIEPPKISTSDIIDAQPHNLNIDYKRTGSCVYEKRSRENE